MDNIKKDFGKRLAEIRKSKKIRQEELKELINAPSVQMISGWENGHTFPSANYLIILAKKLDISLDYLLLGKQTDAKSKTIRTYKDAIECMMPLLLSGLFEIDDYNYDYFHSATTMTTKEETIFNFKKELDTIMAASKSLRPELFKEAIIDLINKYDIPIIKKPANTGGEEK